ncbi:MAG: hypothetical protein WD512_04950 [Candidatus Paceibacterota bacterium]
MTQDDAKNLSLKHLGDEYFYDVLMIKYCNICKLRTELRFQENGQFDMLSGDTLGFVCMVCPKKRWFNLHLKKYIKQGGYDFDFMVTIKKSDFENLIGDMKLLKIKQ